jgi:hypothetical protein
VIVRGKISAGIPVSSFRDLDSGAVYEGVAVAGHGGVCETWERFAFVVRWTHLRQEPLVVVTRYDARVEERVRLERWERASKEAA